MNFSLSRYLTESLSSDILKSLKALPVSFLSKSVKSRFNDIIEKILSNENEGSIYKSLYEANKYVNKELFKHKGNLLRRVLKKLTGFILDSNFVKYSVDDFKKISLSKILEKLEEGRKNLVIGFWCSADGYLLGISKYNNLRCYLNDIDMKSMSQNDKIFLDFIGCDSKDAIRKWYQSHEKSDIINALQYNQIMRQRYVDNMMLIGNPISSRSNMNKHINWNSDPNNYVIFYKFPIDFANKIENINFKRIKARSQDGDGDSSYNIFRDYIFNDNYKNSRKDYNAFYRNKNLSRYKDIIKSGRWTLFLKKHQTDIENIFAYIKEISESVNLIIKNSLMVAKKDHDFIFDDKIDKIDIGLAFIKKLESILNHIVKYKSYIDINSNTEKEYREILTREFQEYKKKYQETIERMKI